MEKICLSCITWNVETTWPEKDVSKLLGINDKGAVIPDAYIVCLQEVKSQLQNVVIDAVFEEQWTCAIRVVLARFDYVQLQCKRLQGIVTSLFVKRHLMTFFRDFSTVFSRTGFKGLWGNKGAVCMRFTLCGCSVCIVNCHLAPHDSGYGERISNYNTIIDTTEFPVDITKNILYHDYVFWLGDLNFRIDSSLTSADIIQLINDGQIGTLYEKDELHRAQSKGEAFSELTEGKLTFLPTYKFLEGTCDYDSIRRPAWTDRILHHVHKDAYEKVTLDIEQMSYSSCMEYGQSDHKPVFAQYKIKVFSGYEDRCVRFAPVKNWYLGVGGKVKYMLDEDVLTSPWDYLALFKANFSSFHQYITYIYAPHVNDSYGSEDTAMSELLSGKKEKHQRTFQVIFQDALVQLEGDYQILYYSGKYNCYLGMSSPFHVVKPPEEIVDSAFVT